MDRAGLFSDAYSEEEALSSSFKKDKDGWHFLWTFEYEPGEADARARFEAVLAGLSLPKEAIGAIHIEELARRDWLAESYHALPPFTVGGFYIYGSHYTGEKPGGKIPLLIEAATAFGSGEHGTTSRCILAIEHVKGGGFAPGRILDMGCGSGILAAAAAKLWPDAQVFAADNDPECVRVTNAHLQSNNIENVHACVSEGYDPASPVWKDAPYDFIIANILAGPLVDMAAEQSRALAKGGYLILSGMLQTQADWVLDAYKPHGLRLAAEFPGDEWMTLLLRKN
jgi:ribosomal protein L11 methyltransferase